VRLGHRFWIHRGRSLAGTIHGDTGDVEDFLIAFPQKRQQERGATSGLIYRPEDLLGERESLLYEPQDVRLLVFDPPAEELCARSVQSR
jgi:hypothetical protein